jgi:tetratricopeptide (TPR) repeat protein
LQSTHFRRLGDYGQAIAAARRALALATAGGDVILQALANLYIGLGYAARGDYRQAIDCLRQTVASLDGARHHERFGQLFLPAVTSRVCLAVCHAELGMFAEGRALGAEGIRIAEAVAHPGSLMWAYLEIGLLFVRQGDLRGATSLLAQAMGICHEVGLSGWRSPIAAVLGAAYTLGGRVADGMSLLTQALEGSAAASASYQTLCRLSMGEAQARAGRLEEAHVCAETVLAYTRIHQARGYQAYALRLLGDIAARRDPPEILLADGLYRQALALADDLGMRPLQAHCHRGLGLLYAATGQRARVELLSARTMYQAMAMAFWLPEIEAVLAQVTEH